MRLELVAGGLRRAHGEALVRVLLQESINRLLGLIGNEAQLGERRHLGKGACLLAVIGLLLENRNRALQRIDRLRIVLVHGIVVGLLHLAHLGGGLYVSSPDRDVFVMLCDLLRQLSSVCRVGHDVRLEHGNRLGGLLDGALLLHAGVVTELLVRCELDLLLVLLVLALGGHVLQELDDLLHRRHLGPVRHTCKGHHEGQTHLHCCHELARVGAGVT
mmetsp:Transcript_83924/g.215988  ORF Transcript_83924/g.215988 Transcript_83924/m.215988 type:complete len:217 (+) Transcript_83924:3-653(+)